MPHWCIGVVVRRPDLDTARAAPVLDRCAAGRQVLQAHGFDDRPAHHVRHASGLTSARRRPVRSAPPPRARRAAASARGWRRARGVAAVRRVSLAEGDDHHLARHAVRGARGPRCVRAGVQLQDVPFANPERAPCRDAPPPSCPRRSATPARESPAATACRRRGRRRGKMGEGDERQRAVAGREPERRAQRLGPQGDGRRRRVLEDAAALRAPVPEASKDVPSARRVELAPGGLHGRCRVLPRQRVGRAVARAPTPAGCRRAATSQRPAASRAGRARARPGAAPHRSRFPAGGGPAEQMRALRRLVGDAAAPDHEGHVR